MRRARGTLSNDVCRCFGMRIRAFQDMMMMMDDDYVTPGSLGQKLKGIGVLRLGPRLQLGMLIPEYCRCQHVSLGSIVNPFDIAYGFRL